MRPKFHFDKISAFTRWEKKEINLLPKLETHFIFTLVIDISIRRADMSVSLDARQAQVSSKLRRRSVT